MKLIKSDENKMLIHLFDVPLLQVKGEWTSSMQEALMNQYGIENPYDIAENIVYNTLTITNQEDQKIIQEEQEIIDCYAMSGEMFGHLLPQKRDALTNQIIYNRFHDIPTSLDTVIRHTQVSQMLTLIMMLCSKEYPKAPQTSFRQVLLKTF